MLEALIFDVDGTLAETERDGHRVAFNCAFRDEGLDWQWGLEEYGRLLKITGGKERIGHYWSQRDPEHASDPSHTERIRTIHATKTRHYVALLEGGAIRLRPGVRRLIEAARSQGVRLAIATTTSPENVAALLRCALYPDALHWFEFIGAGDIVANKKPAPDIYQLALAQMGLATDECIAIEDSVPGFQAAQAAAIPTLVTTSCYFADASFSGALAVLDGLGEPSAPASGAALGRPWTGAVDIDTLQAWLNVRLTR